MNFIKTFTSFITYIILMTIGMGIFLIFLIYGIMFLSGAESLMEKLNELLHNIFPEANIILTDSIKTIIGIPFIIFSMFGLAIVLLTQRTANTKRKSKILKIGIREIYDSEYSELTYEELKKVLDKYEIKYKETWPRSTLLHLVDKKVDKIRKYIRQQKENQK